MDINRRDFLKLSLPALLLPVAAKTLNVTPASAAGTKNSMIVDEKAVLWDATKCKLCHMCEAACRKKNNLPENVNRTVLTSANPDTKQNIQYIFKHQCNHCSEATCLEVCPVGAVHRNEYGFIEINQATCTGCGYCAEFCPFKVPVLEGSSLSGVRKMEKCTGCPDLQAQGKPTACAGACPFGALTVGDRTDQLIKATQRWVEVKDTIPTATIYGSTQLNGMHLIQLLYSSPDKYGLPVDPKVPVTATIHHEILQPIGWGLGALAIAGLGLNYLMARKSMLEKKAKETKG